MFKLWFMEIDKFVANETFAYIHMSDFNKNEIIMSKLMSN